MLIEAAQAPHRPQRPRRRDDDGDFSLAVAPPRPLIPPGDYDAKSVSVHRDRMYSRYTLRVEFCVFEGSFMDGVVLAHVDGFWSLGDDKKRAGPSSRIVRLLQLLDPEATLDRFRGSDLADKLWRIRVATVEKGRDGKHLHPANRYSRVADVMDRIA